MKRKKQYRFKKGGLAMAEGGEFDDPSLYDDELDSEDEGGSTNNQLLTLLTQNMGTTTEAKTQAQKILDNYQSGATSDEEDELVNRMEESADTTRATLKAAREKLMSEKYNDAGMWFKMAGALAAPTKTGSFFESAGRAADVAGEEVGKKDIFERARDKEVLGYDTAADAIDQGTISNRLKLLQARQLSEAALARSALGVLGKPTANASLARTDPRFHGAQALDAIYLKDYLPFISGGSAKATKALYELGLAERELQSGNDKITGPIVGTIRSVSVPYMGEVGDAVADVLWPTGGNVKAMVEGNILESLRQVLGSQFTENEGKRILANTYNPRLDEKIVAKRVTALRLSLEEALKDKNRMATYYQTHGTLAGYPIKQHHIEDFGHYDDGQPNDAKGEDYKLDPQVEFDTYIMPSGDRFQAPKGATKTKILEYYRQLHPEKNMGKDGREIPQGHFKGGRIRSTRQGIANFAEGGPVYFSEAPDEEPEGPSMLEQFKQQLDPGDIVTAPFGAGAGSLIGLGAVGLGTRLEEMLHPERKISPGEKTYLKALRVGNEDLSETGLKIKRARKQGVPATLMDAGSPATRALAERALIQGGARAEQAIDEIESTRNNSRDRVAARVDASLKPLPYFDSQRKLTDALYSNSKPLYAAAYSKYPGIAESAVPAFKKIFDSPDGRRAVKVGLRLLRNQGKTIGKVDAVGMVNKPSLEFLDYVKRGFDQIISKEEKNGPTALGRSQRQLRNQLRDQLDLVSPEYTQARAQYAGDLEVLDALKSGREEFHTLQPDEISTQLAGMSTAEKQAHRTGVAQHLFELIHGPYTDMNAARRIIGSPAMVQRLNLLFPKPADARIFNEALNREMSLFDRQRQMHRRAEQGRQTRMGRELATEASPLKEFGDSTLGRVVGVWNQPSLTMTPDQADEVVDILRRGTPREVNRTLARFLPLQARQIRLRTRRARGAKLGAAIGALVSPFINEPSPTEEEPEE